MSLHPSVPLSDSVSTLSMENYISQPAKSCYCQLRRISSVRKYLSTEDTVKLVTSLIQSHLNYCNSLVSGLPASSVHSLRCVQICAARLILKTKTKTKERNIDHITPPLVLHQTKNSVQDKPSLL